MKPVLVACLLLIAISASRCQIECPAYSTPVYDEKTKLARCEACPLNCAACSWNKETSVTDCSACKEHAYRDTDGSCGMCVYGCESCVGPRVEDCSAVFSGFYFDKIAKAVKKCADGCAACDSAGNCVRCESSYRKVNKVDKDGHPMTLDDNILVDCVKCRDILCSHCAVDAFGNEFCEDCMNETGLNPKTKQCELCSEGCLNCHINSQICNFCKQGYQKDIDSIACKPLTIESCLLQNPLNNKCIWCKTSFIPNPKDGGATCTPCSIADPFCVSCREKTEKEASIFKTDLVCTGCPSKFVLNPDTRKCESCPLHCNYCNALKDCYSCDPGYQLVDYECKKVSIANCEIPNWELGCNTCKPHFYLDSKDANKCKACHADCLSCSGPGDEDSTSCSVDKYKLTVPDTNPFVSFTPINKVKCVQQCPTDFHGKQVVAHDLNRECVEASEGEIKAKSKYAFHRIQTLKSWNVVYHSTDEFVKDYLKHAKHSIETAQHWAKKHPKEAAKYSPQCNHRGVLVEKMTSSRETYYHCDCNKKAHGANCEADDDLFREVQTFAKGIAKDLQELQSSMDEGLYAKILTNLCQAPLAIDSLTELVRLSRKLFAQHTNYKVTDIPQFLSVLDHLLKSFYAEKNELEHRADGFERDIDYQKLLKKIYNQFSNTLTLGDTVFQNSTPHHDHVVDASTQSFQLTDHPATSTSFKQTHKISVLSPNLLGLNELMMPIEVRIKNQQLDRNFADYRVVAWSYSRHLFPPSIAYASHLVYLYSMKVTDKKAKFHGAAFESKDDNVLVTFPLRVVPPDVDLRQAVKCVAIAFGSNNFAANVTDGEIARIGVYDATDRPFVECRYVKKMSGYYFTVVFAKDDVPHAHMLKSAKAMATGDHYRLAVTLDSRPVIAGAASQLAVDAGYFCAAVALLLWLR